jgi:predicted nucleotidyltransferase
MPTTSLRSLAQHLDVPERTLRRAATEGLIHGRRVSERRYETTLREEAYLRRHWPLLRELRAALRTEPNVRLGVLFGSFAAGQAGERSDVDVLVALAEPSVDRVAQITGRLESRLGREVQLVRLQDAERAPGLLADVLAHGRVLIDRDEHWSRLKAAEPAWRARAQAEEIPLTAAMADLDLPE